MQEKKLQPTTRTLGHTYTVLTIGLGASPQSVTHKPKGKEIRTSLGVSSRQGRSFGPSRCKMGASPGARSPSVVVDDDRSTNNHDQGTRRGSTARARTLHQGNKRTARDSPLPFSVHRVQKKVEEALFSSRAQREEPPSQTQRTALVRPLL